MSQPILIHVKEVYTREGIFYSYRGLNIGVRMYFTIVEQGEW